MATNDFTKKQVREYIQGGGNKCPHCQSEDIEAGPSEFEAGLCWQVVHCRACGESWHEIYQLSAIHALDESGEPLDIADDVEN
jgi:hypothetical protein